MTRALPRTSFTSCRLVRTLSRLSVADVADSNQPIAEKLGRWLDVTSAIALFAALNPGSARTTTTPSETISPGGVAMHEELAQARATLVNSISGEQEGKARIKLPKPTPGTPMELQTDFTPYRRYYQAQQRNMAATIGPLRTRARDMLAGCPPRQRQLAELDATLDSALGKREGELLAALPSLLEKHFGNLWQAHRTALADPGKDDHPEQWLHPGGWLALFRRDLQDVLLAELELRLQPVTGLIEAYGSKVASINE
jgi:hypothetical protein